ncbi:MAG: type II CAAX endopeptidase family protein [Bacteroidota bacterium]|nr:type II CAAX endopeptidase family protein [Bacteroidota bacterium]
MAKINKTNLFIILTFIVSWGIEALFYFSGYKINDPLYQVMGIGVMWVPGLVAIIIQLIYKEPLISSLKLSLKPNIWFIWAIATPFALVFITIILSICFPGVFISWDMKGFYDRISLISSPEMIQKIKDANQLLSVHPFIIGIGGAIVGGATINAIVALGEEIGWRGLLMNELKHKGYFNASMQTGLIWGVWHAPLILMGHNYPEHPIAGVGMMVLFCVFISPIFSYIYLRANSIWAPAMLHGVLNAAAPLSFMILNRSDDLLLGLTGLAGLGTILLGMAFFMDYDKQWSKNKVFYE